MSHIVSGSFSPVTYGYLILHKPAVGLNGEVSGDFSCVFFFSLLGSEWSKKAKGRLLEDSEWELEEISGNCRTERGFGEQLTGLGRFLPQPSLISPSHHLLSGCGSPSCVPLWGYCTSSSSLGPFCSQSSCLPSAVSRPALFKLWYPTGFVEEPEEEPWEAGCLLLLLIATSHHPHYSLAEASVPPSIGQAVVPISTLREAQATSTPWSALLLPSPSSVLNHFCTWSCSCVTASDVWEPPPQSRKTLKDRWYLLMLIIANISVYPPFLKYHNL